MHRTLILDSFERAYATLFGRTIERLPVEIANWSLTVSTDTPPVSRLEPSLKAIPANVSGHRDLVDAALRKNVAAAEVRRAEMEPGQWIEGPAIIFEDETSTIITSAYRAVIQNDSSILATRKANCQ
ncbi:MAG: hypothetical protein OXN84_01360 [Albidovulum sp.]|nr:hypothetical protein [Albidovulum sp.]